jgi:uncharacterized membrane protein
MASQPVQGEVMDDPALLLLRLLHIAAGIFWVGAAVTSLAFLEPALHDLGDDGHRFMRYLTKRRRLPEFVTAAAATNLVAGGLLYWRVSGGFQAGWMLSPVGIGFTIGALAAIVAAAIAGAFILPTLKRLESVGQHALSAQTSGEEQLADLQRLERRLRLASLANVAALTVAVVAMATARYWG